MLKHGSPQDIRSMFNRMRTEVRGLLKEIISLVYYMRGSIQYEDMIMRTPVERELIHDFIDERFEQEKKNPYPVY